MYLLICIYLPSTRLYKIDRVFYKEKHPVNYTNFVVGILINLNRLVLQHNAI